MIVQNSMYKILYNIILYKKLRMIDFLFLTIPSSLTYESIKIPVVFPDDKNGFSNWVFKQSLAIYSSDLTQKHLFTEEGVQVYKVSNANLQQKWKYFVATQADGSRIYCTSHIFYEKSPLKFQQKSIFHLGAPNIRQQEFYLPKCLIISSQKPYFKLQTNLIKVHRQLRRNNPWICQSVVRLTLESLDNEINSKQQNQLSNYATQKKKSNVSSSITSSRFSKFPSNKKVQNLIENLFNYYVSMCNNNNLSQKLLICPQNKLQILHMYNIPDSLYQFNYFFHLPISLDTLFKIISAILQQKQIIFTSSNQNSNVMLMQTILQMISPLKWQYMYAPNLPPSMIEAAEECFMPYMVGIHKKNLHRINTNNRIVVHVDKDIIECNERVPELPFILKQVLSIYQVGVANLQYLDWEKYMRIKSILMISTLMGYQNSWRKARLSDYEFYQYFFLESSLYIQYRQNIHKQKNKQLIELVPLTLEEKIKFIQTKFKVLYSQANSPTICDNYKEWIKYCESNFQIGRRSLKNARSSYALGNTNRSYMRSSMISSSMIYSSTIDQTNQSMQLSRNENRGKRLTMPRKGIGYVLSTIKI